MIGIKRHPTDPTIAVMHANGMWVIIAPNDVVRFRTIDGARKWLDSRREWQVKELKTAQGGDVVIVKGNIEMIDWQADQLKVAGECMTLAQTNQTTERRS